MGGDCAAFRSGEVELQTYPWEVYRPAVRTRDDLEPFVHCTDPHRGSRGRKRCRARTTDIHRIVPTLEAELLVPDHHCYSVQAGR
jgi:hypothetical protein